MPRVADNATQDQPREHHGVTEQQLKLSQASIQQLSSIIERLEELDIYETSKNLSLLNDIQVEENTELATWKSEMENAVFSFNEQKYHKLISLIK